MPENILPEKFAAIINDYKKSNPNPIEEIRFRTARKIVISHAKKHIFLDYIITRTDIDEILSFFCQRSIYAYTDEIKNGFLTLNGGHRAGLCGRAVFENGNIKNICDINSINLRIAREIKGVALPYIKKILVGENIKNTLFISPPGYGKTTVIRDVARILGQTKRVSLIDERCEISGSSSGIPYFDIGDMTDIMELCEKQTASEIMIRTMSPDVIVLDELSRDDSGILKRIISSGVKVIATAHGDSADSVLKRLELPACFNVITLPKRRD